MTACAGGKYITFLDQRRDLKVKWSFRWRAVDVTSVVSVSIGLVAVGSSGIAVGIGGGASKVASTSLHQNIV